MDSSPGSLSPFQWRVLRAFFERERAFFLTGGAALAGFHLGHRTTGDLDLFSVDDEGFERGPHVMGAVADAIGAELLVRQDAPGFKRFALLLDGEAGIKPHLPAKANRGLRRSAIFGSPPA